MLSKKSPQLGFPLSTTKFLEAEKHLLLEATNITTFIISIILHG